MRRRDTGSIAFRVSLGGTGGNILEASEEVDEETMRVKYLARAMRFVASHWTATRMAFTNMVTDLYVRSGEM